jgi:hypothetical protein
MSKQNKDPGFIRDFKNRESAVLAMKMLVHARENGYTNKQIIQVDLFRKLFRDEYLTTHSDFQIECRLKNGLRDIGKYSFEDLAQDWWPVKAHFESFRRTKL